MCWCWWCCNFGRYYCLTSCTYSTTSVVSMIFRFTIFPFWTCMSTFLFLSWQANISFVKMSDLPSYISYMHLYYLGVVVLTVMDALPSWYFCVPFINISEPLRCVIHIQGHGWLRKNMLNQCYVGKIFWHGFWWLRCSHTHTHPHTYIYRCIYILI